jgi:hypothetical protein
VRSAADIKRGRVYQIEAVINTAAFGISSGWEPSCRAPAIIGER